MFPLEKRDMGTSSGCTLTSSVRCGEHSVLEQHFQKLQSATVFSPSRTAVNKSKQVYHCHTRFSSHVWRLIAVVHCCVCMLFTRFAQLQMKFGRASCRERVWQYFLK